MKKTAMKKTTKPAALPSPSDFISHASGALDEGIHQLNQCIRDRSATLERCLRDVESLPASGKNETFLNTLIAELGPFEYNTRIVSIIGRLMEFSEGLKNWEDECRATIRRAHDKFKQEEYTTSHGLTKSAPSAIRLDPSKPPQDQAEAIIESFMVDGQIEGTRVLPDYDYKFLRYHGNSLYSESIAGYINAILCNEFRSDGDVWTRVRKLTKLSKDEEPAMSSEDLADCQISLYARTPENKLTNKDYKALLGRCKLRSYDIHTEWKAIVARKLGNYTYRNDFWYPPAPRSNAYDETPAPTDAPSVPATYDGEAIDRLFQGKETPEQVAEKIIRDASDRDGTIPLARFNGLIDLLRSKDLPHVVGMALSSALDRYDKISDQAGTYYQEKIVPSKACDEAADARRFITCRAGPDGRLSNESFEFLKSMVKVNSGNRSAIFCNELSYQLSCYRKEGLLWFPVYKSPPTDAANEASASAVILGESPGK